jgi:hypothetical protein
MRRALALITAAAALSGTAATAATAAPFKVRLRTPHHQPRVCRDWPIKVIVRSHSGHKLRASAKYQFLHAGQVVSTQYPDPHGPKNCQAGRRSSPWHFRGSFRDVLQFPSYSVGYRLTFRVVVHVRHRGTVHRDHRIRVRL